MCSFQSSALGGCYADRRVVCARLAHRSARGAKLLAAMPSSGGARHARGSRYPACHRMGVGYRTFRIAVCRRIGAARRCAMWCYVWLLSILGTLPAVAEEDSSFSDCGHTVALFPGSACYPPTRASGAVARRAVQV